MPDDVMPVQPRTGRLRSANGRLGMRLLRSFRQRKAVQHQGDPVKVVSWNLLRRTGASLDDLVRLIESERPDLLLMQEATQDMAGICERAGGFFARTPLPDRIHGLAVWTPTPLPQPPTIALLPPGALIRRICQLVDLGEFRIVNVHLSHGQVLNRRQLRRIAEMVPGRAAVLGDFNLVGPHLLPGFRDVGPRLATHRMGDMVPLRLDRCLARGLICTDARVLPRQRSDHHPIAVCLSVDPAELRPTRQQRLKDRATPSGTLHRVV